MTSSEIRKFMYFVTKLYIISPGKGGRCGERKMRRRGLRDNDK
jgi:hypothetical protein